MTERSLLSRPAILRLIREGKILVDPFQHSNVGTNSYDVTLGKYYWRETDPYKGNRNRELPVLPDGNVLYNPYDKDHVEKLWKLEEALPVGTQYGSGGQGTLFEEDWPYKNIFPEDKVIWIGPGEAILAHTVEYIGGCSNDITTMMKARSSIGRNFLETARCAGMGDIGYCNRWTMEITNNSRYHTIPLVVGRRVAQIVFFQTEEISSSDYTKVGKYQTVKGIEAMKRAWNPESMLPKMYLDREVQSGRAD